MTHVREVGLLLMLVASGCAASEPAADASMNGDDTRVLVAQMAQQYDDSLTHRCECLVERGLLYDSVESCLASIGWDATGEDCIAEAFDEHGTDKLRSALRCHVGHLQNASACTEAVTCEELLIDGACDATSAGSPCGQDETELYAFIFERCPQLDLHARK